MWRKGAHSPTLPLFRLRDSSFSNHSFASPTSQALHLIHLASHPCLRTLNKHELLFVRMPFLLHKYKFIWLLSPYIPAPFPRLNMVACKTARSPHEGELLQTQLWLLWLTTQKLVFVRIYTCWFTRPGSFAFKSCWKVLTLSAIHKTRWALVYIHVLRCTAKLRFIFTQESQVYFNLVAYFELKVNLPCSF